MNKPKCPYVYWNQILTTVYFFLIWFTNGKSEMLIASLLNADFTWVWFLYCTQQINESSQFSYDLNVYTGNLNRDFSVFKLLQLLSIFICIFPGSLRSVFVTFKWIMWHCCNLRMYDSIRVSLLLSSFHNWIALFSAGTRMQPSGREVGSLWTTPWSLLWRGLSGA